jgi:putative ABC transport system permease protein
MIGSTEMPVTGLLNRANPERNSSSIFITISDAQKMLNVNGVSEISIRTPDYKTSEKYQKDLEDTFAGYQVWSWQKIGKSVIEMFQIKSSGSKTLVFFIILVGLIGTINTMLLSVYEKQREIGMMKAMGMRDRDVQTMFVLEGMMIGLLGSVVGMAFGTLIEIPMIYSGLDFTSIMGGTDGNYGFRVMGTLKGSWKLSSYVSALFISVLTTTLASFYPARKATKMQPVECLRITQ